MSKYSRHQSVISRDSDSQNDDNWLKQFQDKLAVQPAQSKSIFDQINAIINTKSKYPSVEAAVEDMKNRSGLTAYLKQSTIKNASDNSNVIDKNVPLESIQKIPVIIKKYPNVKNTLQNIISSSSGNLALPAIINKLRSIHCNDVAEDKDWEDPLLIVFVSHMNLNEKQKHPSVNINENRVGLSDNSSTDSIDPSNTDAFHILNPAKG